MALIFSRLSMSGRPINRWEVYDGDNLIADISFPTKKEGKFLIPWSGDRSFSLDELKEIIEFMESFKEA
jgi:hypothetical protein